MKKQAIAAAVALATGLPCAAQDRDAALGEVVVTATRFPEVVSQYPVGVNVITDADIRNSTASTVPELLRKLSGVQTRNKTGSPNLPVDLRGFGVFGDRNTLVLLDGQRISENEQRAVNWSLIPLNAIERIEILRGSGAVLYGAGATGGTINVITRAPRANTRGGFIEAGAGSHDLRDLRIGVNVAGERSGLRLTMSRRETDNYRDNNALRNENAELYWRHTAQNGELTLKAGADDQRVQLPGSISEAQIATNRRQAALPGDFTLLSEGYLNFGGSFRLGSNEFAANLSYRGNKTDSSFFVAFPYRNNVQTTTRQLLFTPRARLPHRAGGLDHVLVAGIDVEDWDYQSDAGPSVVGRPQATQSSEAVYAQHTTLLAGGTSIVIGLRSQRMTYSVADPANAVARSERTRSLQAHELALSQPLGRGWAAYAKVGSSFRVPNVNDNFNLFTATVNLLEPQTARDRELGLRSVRGGARYRLAIYEIQLDNEILLDPVTYSNRNLPPTRRRGAEAEARWQATEGLYFSAAYTYAEAEFRAGSFGAKPIAGNEVPLVPRHSGRLGAGWKFAAHSRLDAALLHTGAQRYDGDELNAFNRKMPAYTVVDLKLSHEQADWRFTASVQNLLNRQYYSYGIYTGFPSYSALPAPERTFYLSARRSFN